MRWKTGLITSMTLLIIAGSVLAQTASCPELVRTALAVASEACEGIGRNQVCYGNIQLEGEPKAGIEEFVLEAPGDMVDAASLQTLRLSALDEDADMWGIALMNLQANIPATLPGQNVTFLLFGDVEITDAMEEESEDVAPLQAFYFKSGLNDAPCPEAPDSGVLIQTPEGAQRIEFRVNEVTVTLGSTAYVQAQAGGTMTISVVEGEAEVEAEGTTVTVPAGYQTSVPLDDDLNADGAPSEPEEFDPADLAALPLGNLPRLITLDAEATPEATNEASSGATLPTGGEWVWVTGTPSSGGCPAGTAEFTASQFTPTAPFTLPGDAFGIEVFFTSAFSGAGGAPPNAVFSQPDANTYHMEFDDGMGGYGVFELHVISAALIEGSINVSSQDCSITIPFTATLVE